MLFPVPTDVPPQEPVNHSATAAVPSVPPLTVSVVDCPLQIVVVPEIVVGAIESVFTVTVETSVYVMSQIEAVFEVAKTE